MSEDAFTRETLDALLSLPETFKQPEWTMVLSVRELIALDALGLRDDVFLDRLAAGCALAGAPTPVAIVCNAPIGDVQWCYWRKENDDPR
jgi:hypothetical protein